MWVSGTQLWEARDRRGVESLPSVQADGGNQHSPKQMRGGGGGKERRKREKLLRLARFSEQKSSFTFPQDSH